jgi:hypothetical protein
MAAEPPLVPSRSWPFHRHVQHSRSRTLRGLAGLASFVAATALALPAAAQPAADPGQVVLQVSGADGMFGFSSATLPLNLMVASSDGFAESLPISLPPGSYTVAADDLSGLGFVVTALSCTDDDSLGDAATRTAEIVLAADEMVTCTFTVTSSTTRASELIGNFMRSHDLVLDSLPSADDRANRLKGRIGVISSPKPLLQSLPGLMGGKPVPLAASLAAFDRLSGNQQQSDFDVWLKGTYALLEEQGPLGRFATTTLGIDYRLSGDLLVGSFAQFNLASRTWKGDEAILATGWAAGGYATYRIADHLYLDMLAGGGTSVNSITTTGLGTDQFDAAGWLLNATLLGKWELAGFTFSPRVQVKYSGQTTESYIDSAGGIVDAQHRDVGQVALGPSISYRLVSAEKLVVETSVRFDASTTMLNGIGLGSYRGRLEGKAVLTLPTGAKFGTTLNLGGIGSGTRVFTARGTLSLPLR